MRVLVFGASSSRASINKILAEHAARRLQTELLPDVVVDVIDLNDFEMPIYSIDRERADGIPAPAHRFFDVIGAADGIIVAYAEHNGFYTAAFKNIFDWASRIRMKVFQERPCLVLSTSIGRGGGAHVLEVALASAPHFGAEVVASLAVPRFQDAFDVDADTLTDPALASALGDALTSFAERLKRGAL